MIERRFFRIIPFFLALAAAVTLTPAASILAQTPGEDPLTRFAPAMLPDFTGDLAAYPDAPRYTIDLALALDESGATLDGHQQVRYTNRTPGALGEVVFRLYPNLRSYGGEMTVSNVTVDGAAAETRLDSTRTVLRVALPEPLAPGAETTLTLDYEIRVQAERERLYAQFSDIGGVLALPNAYAVLSVYEPGAGWWDVAAHPQGDAVYSETAFYEVSLSAPQGLIIAATGSEIAVSEGDAGTLVHHYVAPLMRDFAFFASERYVTLSGAEGGVTITLYYDPARPNAAQIAQIGLILTKEAVHIFNETFGPYPFSELDVVQTPTSAGGIEYPGLFVVADQVWDKAADYFLFVIIHETAHQWWYSLIGNDQTLDPWMDEALAQFSVALFIGRMEGEDAYDASMTSYAEQVSSFTRLGTDFDRPIGLPVSDYSGRAYFYMVYQKGPLFFGALVERFGADAVIGALQDYFAAYRYGIAEPVDMLLSFEQSLGADLDALFAEWVGEFPVG